MNECIEIIVCFQSEIWQNKINYYWRVYIENIVRLLLCVFKTKGDVRFSDISPVIKVAHHYYFLEDDDSTTTTTTSSSEVR